MPLPSSLSFPHFSFLIFTTSSTNPLWCYFSRQFPSAPSLSGQKTAILLSDKRYGAVVKGPRFLERAESNSSGGNEGKNKKRDFIHFVNAHLTSLHTRQYWLKVDLIQFTPVQLLTFVLIEVKTELAPGSISSSSLHICMLKSCGMCLKVVYQKRNSVFSTINILFPQMLISAILDLVIL